jgi:hypothetical protein
LGADHRLFGAQEDDEEDGPPDTEEPEVEGEEDGVTTRADDEAEDMARWARPRE